MNIPKCKKLEKSRGILAFAYNVATIDYVSIANQTLKLASKKLNLPYTLITDNELVNNTTNTRYDIDSKQFIHWRNVGRHCAYDLTPYEETLVIDVDYLVLDQNLNKVFETDWDYLLARDSVALTEDWPVSMGENSLPYVWATVFAFRKTKKAKLFFDLVGRIQRNYSYYSALFNVRERNYRNDYAFAMADIILNGYTIENKSIPGKIIAINQPISKMYFHNNQIVVKEKSGSFVLPKTNLHVMSKSYLQSQNFENFISEFYERSA